LAGGDVVSQAEQLRQQAATAQQLAEVANLQNVRARYLHSATVWTQLAEKAERLEEMQSCDLDWDQ
jgi:hypothetical protein